MRMKNDIPEILKKAKTALEFADARKNVDTRSESLEGIGWALLALAQAYHLELVWKDVLDDPSTE